MRCAICCIIVLFHPNKNVSKKIEMLSSYGYKVVVVSNGSKFEILDAIRETVGVVLIENSNNVGLATALNQGVRAALIDPTVEYIALFDQDSDPSLDMPEGLVDELQRVNEFVDVACIGPQLADVKSMGTHYGQHNRGAGWFGVESIPTSGTVISREAFELVGPMMDALFIDGIDHEWCLRASTKGLRVLISEKFVMLHDMGDAGLNWFGEYKPIYRNPIRHFYIIRNAIYLGLYAKIPLKWRIMQLLKTFRRMPVYFLASSSRMHSLMLMTKGVIDGVLKRLGPLSLVR